MKKLITLLFVVALSGLSVSWAGDFVQGGRFTAPPVASGK